MTTAPLYVRHSDPPGDGSLIGSGHVAPLLPDTTLRFHDPVPQEFINARHF